MHARGMIDLYCAIEFISVVELLRSVIFMYVTVVYSDRLVILMLLICIVSWFCLIVHDILE